MKPTIAYRAHAMWVAATPLQRASFSFLAASMLYLTVLLGKVLLDDGSGNEVRIAAGLFLIFTLRLLLSAMGMLYGRFVIITSQRFYRQAESVEAEDAFIEALAPREFELLYKETLPRCGFIGVLKAHEVARNAAPRNVEKNDRHEKK